MYYPPAEETGRLDVINTMYCIVELYGVSYIVTGNIPAMSLIAQSVWQLTMGWTVQGWNPGGGEIFCTHPDRPWGPPSLLYNGYRVFPGGKAAGAWC
jgi:hypothetical protein